MALLCYNTSATVRDMLERAGDGVADADMTGEESRGNAALNIHTFRRIEKKKTQSARKVQARPGAGEKKREGEVDPNGEAFPGQ